MKKTLLNVVAIAALAIFSSCEGPMGPEGPTGAAGVDGINGTDGKDMNETCKLCHKNGGEGSVDSIAVQYELSKHSHGAAAFEEAGSTGCSPCHTSEAFQDVVKRNVPSTFTLNATTGNYVLNYSTQAHTTYGAISCGTCHNKIHATYGASDIPSLTTVAPVSMVMWGGNKSINLTTDAGGSNLCVKCHQPRAIAINSGASPTGGPLDYEALAATANHNKPIWTGTSATAGTGIYKPNYRSHVHYGAVGAVYAGVGGVEVPGDEQYINTKHTEVASCQDCHMAKVSGRAGGHTFKVRSSQGALVWTGNGASTFNFNGCNTTGCHTGVDAKSAKYWLTPRTNMKNLLDQLAGLLKVTHNNGTIYELLNKNANASETTAVLNPATGTTSPLGVNLWAGETTNNYDGYLNIINSANSNTGATTIPDTYFTLTYLQMAAIINFQFALREYSLGIHNYAYTHALIHNTVKAFGVIPVN